MKIFFRVLLIIVVFAPSLSNAFAFNSGGQDGDGLWYISRGEGKLPEINALNVKGDIILAGSSTVYPLVERLADAFADEGYSGSIEISSIGSGAGFERWAKNGETDIANASRPIKPSEVEAAKKIGRDPIEFFIGTDAIVIIVNSGNTWVKNVTKQELAKIFTSRKWSDVNPSWPAENILKFSPGTDSGTFDYFTEVIFGNKKEMLLNALNVQLSEDDNILSRGVQGNKYAIGYFGYTYYKEESKKLTVLSIEGVKPEKESVVNHIYPLARPLFIYSSASIIQKKTQVAAFLAYVLSNVTETAAQVGYFPADPASLKAAANKLLSVMQPLMNK